MGEDCGETVLQGINLVLIAGAGISCVKTVWDVAELGIGRKMTEKGKNCRQIWKKDIYLPVERIR